MPFFECCMLRADDAVCCCNLILFYVAAWCCFDFVTFCVFGVTSSECLHVDGICVSGCFVFPSAFHASSICFVMSTGVCDIVPCLCCVHLECGFDGI